MDASRSRLPLEHWSLVGGGAVLLALILVGLGGSHNWWGNSLQLRFRATSAAGLSPGMPVKISGYPVGTVQRIRLLDDAQILVTLSIAANRQAIVGRNSRASLAQDSLLGQNYIAISPDLGGGTGGRTKGLPHRDGAGNAMVTTLIYDDNNTSTTTLLNDLAASRVPLQRILSSTAGLVETRIPNSLNQLDRTLRSGQQLADGVRPDLEASANGLMGRLDTTAGNLDQAIGTLRSTLTEIESLARTSNSFLRSLHSSWLMKLLEPEDPSPPKPAPPSSIPSVAPAAAPAAAPVANPAQRCGTSPPCRQ